MGEKAVPISLANRLPDVIMLSGLQGSGKTTFAGKLGQYLKKKGRNTLLVAADIYRPAAIEQLHVVAKSVGLKSFSEDSRDAVAICKHAIEFARKNMLDTAIIDTAGRLHLDEELMDELVRIKQNTNPSEILFVADGMTGQDAVNTATSFLDRLDFDGVVLTKMDGDARGGAASIHSCCYRGSR